MAREFEGLCWATGIEEHCVCVFVHVGQEPQFLLRKTVSWCFCHPLTSCLLRLLASRDANCGGQRLAQQGEDQLL